MALLHATPSSLRRLPFSPASASRPPRAAVAISSIPLRRRPRKHEPILYCLAPTTSDEPKRSILISSDVPAKHPITRTLSSGRKWTTLLVIPSLHLLSLFAPFTFSWRALWTAFTIYIITGLLGITLSFHRNLSHKSFILPKWLEYAFAYCGVLALQGSPMDWVSTHRYHHQFCDSDRDPHSPKHGFWHSHMTWLFNTTRMVSSNVGDMAKQPFYRFIQATYVLHPIALGLLLYAAGGFPFVVWGMGVRTVWLYHITWLVNSACHGWGRKAWDTGDLSTNNWWVAALAFGEGWHNNHHAFEYSARHGMEWWEVDLTWYVVRLLEVVGLATEVKVPSEVQRQRMSLAAAEGGGGTRPSERLNRNVP